MAVGIGKPKGVLHVQSYRGEVSSESDGLTVMRAEVSMVGSPDQITPIHGDSSKSFAVWLAGRLIATMSDDERKQFIADLVAQRLIQP